MTLVVSFSHRTFLGTKDAEFVHCFISPLRINGWITQELPQHTRSTRLNNTTQYHRDVAYYVPFIRIVAQISCGLCFIIYNIPIQAGTVKEPDSRPLTLKNPSRRTEERTHVLGPHTSVAITWVPDILELTFGCLHSNFATPKLIVHTYIPLKEIDV